MNIWDRLNSLSGVIAAVVIPVALAYIGNEYTSAIKQREIEVRFVELALDILRKKPEGESTELRSWGTQIIDKYSGVPFTDTARQQLIESKSLPEASLSRTRIITNIPESGLASVIALLEVDGATDIKSVKQADGTFTVTAKLR